MKSITTEGLKYAMYGACFLASGGGGGLGLGKQLLGEIGKNLEKQGAREIPVAALSDLKDLDRSKMISVTAGIGSPDAGERGIETSQFINAYAVMRDYLAQKEGCELDYIMPVELGAANSLVPFLIASAFENGRVTVLDSDSAGRAVPELEMTLLNAAGIRISPVMLAAKSQPGTDKFNYSCIQDDVAVRAEQAARELIGSSMFNETAGISCYPAACPDIGQEHVNSGSLWTAEKVGEFFKTTKLNNHHLERFVRVLGRLGLEAYNLCTGELVDKREKSGGFDIGNVTIRGDDGQECWIYFKNENLLAWDVQKEAPLAMGPDSICYLNLDSGLPFSNAEIMSEVMPGAKIGVIGIKALPGMRNPRFVNIFMESIHDFQPIPKYIPIEDLQ